MTDNAEQTQPVGEHGRSHGVFTSRAVASLQFAALLLIAVLAVVIVRGLEQDLVHKEIVIAEISALTDGLGTDPARLIAAANRAMATKPPGMDRDRFFSELVRARQEVAVLREERERLAGAAEALNSVRRELQGADTGDAVEQVIGKLTGVATALMEYEEAHGTRSGLIDEIAGLSGLLEKRDLDLRRSKDLTKKLQRALERAQRVQQKPSCWIDVRTENPSTSSTSPCSGKASS